MVSDKTHKAENIIKEWRDYEGNVVKLKKDFDDTVKKTKLRTCEPNTPSGYSIY